MFYKNKLKTKATTEKEFEYNLFEETPKNLSDDKREIASTKLVYNFITEDGALKSGYGFEVMKSPESTTDVDTETTVSIRGSDVKAIWRLKWWDYNTDTNHYYIFYYNDEGYICYDNLFMYRIATLIVPNDYTETPFATYYRADSQDALLLSGEGDNLMVITGSGVETCDTAPLIKSCCSHYGKLFAVTASASSTLVYNEDTDITAWTDEKTKNLDFSDERGDLNKIISFDDYLYVFRDYGITKVSIYSSDEEFSINHMYQSDSYIYPNSIAQGGDRVFFLERSGLKSFNGSSVQNIELDCDYLLMGLSQKSCWATTFDGKYYLACRCDFDDGETIGCEGNSGGYINNTLIVYDYLTEHVDIMRGADINQVLALNNPYKSKLVACFYNQNKGKIGQLTKDGKLFGENLKGVWQSVKTDLGCHGQKKRIKSFNIKTSGEVKVVLASEGEEKTYTVLGSSKLQKVRTNVVGNEFSVKIIAEGDVAISNFILQASVAK